MPPAVSGSPPLAELLRELGELRVQLRAEQGRLRCVAPAGVLTAELLSRVRKRRGELLRHLSGSDADTGAVALSYPQESIWLRHHLDPDDSAHNIPLDAEIEGPVWICALRAALTTVTRRHEPLRTTFAVGGGRPQQVVHPTGRLAMPLVDLTGLPDAIAGKAADQIAAAVAARPFDLTRAPGSRPVLLRRDPHCHRLLITRHHLVSDGWSLGVLTGELEEGYAAAIRGRAASLPPLDWRYRDFVQWQRDTTALDGLSARLSRWHERLSGAPDEPALDPPSDARPAGAAMAQRVNLPGPLGERINALARQAGTTPFTVLAVALGLALAATARTREILIGVAVSGRSRVETQRLIGCFATVLPLRLGELSTLSFHQALVRGHEAVTQLLQDQDVPLEQIMRQVWPGRRRLGRPWPFAAVFAYQNTPESRVRLPGLQVSARDPASVAPKFPLTITASRAGAGYELVAEHDPRVVPEETAGRLLLRIMSILEGGADGPARMCGELLDALRTSARREVPPSSRRAGQTLGQRFNAQAALTPDAVAVQDVDGNVTYAALRHRANGIAGALAAAGVAVGDRVAVCAPHGAALVASIVGISLAGATYVPLDPEDPPARHEYVLGDADVAAIVSLAQWRDRFDWFDRPLVCADGETAAPAVPVRPLSSDQTAYVIYTSGSTGAPKGVMVSHRNVLSLIDATVEQCGFSAAEVWTMTHSAAFDFSVWEMWTPLLTGARLVAVPRETVRDAGRLLRVLRAERVSVYCSTPSALDALVGYAAAQQPKSRAQAWPRRVVLGGERCDPARLGHWLSQAGPGTELVNMYGITETTVHVTHRVLRPADSSVSASPIGLPLAGVGVAILDPLNEPVPQGESGELAVGGWGVAAGYLGRPGLTAERFRPGTQGPPGARRYLSGDLGAWRDGELTYLGRLDRQVKIRGHRIEPGEVASVLSGHPHVVNAAVVPLSISSRTELAAYIVPAPERAAPTAQDLRRYLLERLPAYMLPTRYALVESLPLTRNGKLDIARLPTAAPMAGAQDGDLPRTETERVLAAMWAELLQVPTVGRHDDFFLLGGDSLLVTRLHVRLQARFGVEVPVRPVYEAADLAALAELIDGLRSGGPGQNAAAS